MAGLAFINYRRDDTSQIAQALYMQLKETFGAGQLFMDVNSIRLGQKWPAHIARKLDEATVVLALMGPGWPTVRNKDGKRRIEDRSDWVRKELLHAIAKRTPIIPIAITFTISDTDLKENKTSTAATGTTAILINCKRFARTISRQPR